MLLLLGLAGCGNPAGIAKVSGTLSYKGKPVPNAYVDFMPSDGKRPSWGLTDEQGKFTLEYDAKIKGAAVGKHKVFVRMKPTTTAEQEAVMMGRKPPMSKDMATFYDKYGADKSKVEVTVDKNVEDLKLEWD